MPKSSHKKGGAKKEYTGTYRHFTLHEVNGKEVEIGTADIKDYQTPLNAAKKLLSSYYRHQGIKSNERNKYDIKFCIRETTRGHSKIYGPYKGKFVKYDKPLMIKLKSGKVIKRLVKPMVKLAKGNNNKKMVGGQSNIVDESPEDNSKSNLIIKNNNLEDIDNDNDLKNLIRIVREYKEDQDLSEKDKKLLKKYQFKKGRSDKGIERYNIKFSDFNVSGIRNMKGLFQNFDFNNAKCIDTDITKWNVSNVIDMNSMFKDSKGFNQNLSKWDMFGTNYIIIYTNGTRKKPGFKSMDLENMFDNCKDFSVNWGYFEKLEWYIHYETKVADIFTKCEQLIDNKNMLKSIINIYFCSKERTTLKRLTNPISDSCCTNQQGRHYYNNSRITYKPPYK